MSSATPSQYKDIPAVALENDHIRLKFLPGHGGKLASFFDKAGGFELLTQAPGETYKTLAYDGDYAAAECSGFDDMFPCIDKCYYMKPPWTGTAIPDHGEVCALPWKWEIAGDVLNMEVHGIRFPYTLRKSVRLGGGRSARIDYALVNHSPFPFDCQWYAHAMFNAEAGGRVLVPVSDGAAATWLFGHGHYGDKVAWPHYRLPEGGVKDLGSTAPFNPDSSWKICFDRPLPEGWCGYAWPSRGLALKMRFPVDRVPYFSLWCNEGRFKGYYNVALEIGTGNYDRLDVGMMHRQFTRLEPYGVCEWSLELGLESFAAE